MKLKTSLLALGLGLSIQAPLLAAERDVLVPLPSIFDLSDGDGWGIGLGAGIEYESAYDGSDEYEVEFDPAGAVQWRQGDSLYFWEGYELGWRGLVSEDWLLQAGIRYESGLEADDSDDDRLEGLEDRDSHTVGFFEARQSIGADWRNWVGGRLMGGDSDFGWLGVIAAGHRFGAQRDGTGTELLGFVTFGDADFINKDFGLSDEDAAATGLEAIEIDSGYRSTGLTLIHRRDLNDNLQLLGQVGVELYSDDIQDSDIARNDYEAETGISLIWVF